MCSATRLALCAAILSTALLAGCFSSEKPLLTEEDAVTPLPDAFALFETDGSGNLKTEDTAPSLNDFAKIGKIYLHKAGPTKVTLTIAELDHNGGMFLVQDVTSAQDPAQGETQMVTYYVAKLIDNAIVQYAPPAPGRTGLDAALKQAGVIYQEKGNQFVFADKMQLLAAARVYASRLVEGEIAQFRVATTKQEIEALQNEIAAAHAVPATAPAVPQPPAPPPTAAPAQDAGAATPISRQGLQSGPDDVDQQGRFPRADVL